MRTLRIDAQNGASGDMFLGAILDLGVPVSIIEKAARAVEPHGWSISSENVMRNGISSLYAKITLENSTTDNCHVSNHKHNHEHNHEHKHGRSAKSILSAISSAELKPSVAKMATLAFTLLAEVEAKIHGRTFDDVHFHEVGAIDAVVDIVGACAGIDYLGVGEVIVSSIGVGSGTIECAHGVLPIPAPATAELLQGVSITALDAQGELCTPTGAALLRAIGTSFSNCPSMIVESHGYGAGSRNTDCRANVLRFALSKNADCKNSEVSSNDKNSNLVEISCNIDDMTPECLAHTVDCLIGAGALDAWVQPIVMKKGRAAHLLSALCFEKHREILEYVIFRETSTFGIRRYAIERTELDSRVCECQTPYGGINVRIGMYRGTDISWGAEYEECLALSYEVGVPLMEIQRTAIDAAKKEINTYE